VADLTTFLSFIGAALAMQLVPGPETALVISRGVGQGWRIALCTVLGMTVGAGLIQVPLLALGIASVVHSSPVAFELLRWAGAAYLIWLGVKLLLPSKRRHQVIGATTAAGRRTELTAIREGMIANLTNPYPLVFMLAFLPQFVDPALGSVTAQLLVLGITQKATGFLVLSSMALASGVVGDSIARRPHFVVWQERFAGAVMVILGLRLLLQGVA
jgi:threonine/homoserine/homoserine lactone efflux protein